MKKKYSLVIWYSNFANPKLLNRKLICWYLYIITEILRYPVSWTFIMLSKSSEATPIPSLMFRHEKKGWQKYQNRKNFILQKLPPLAKMSILKSIICIFCNTERYHDMKIYLQMVFVELKCAFFETKTKNNRIYRDQ